MCLIKELRNPFVSDHWHTFSHESQMPHREGLNLNQIPYCMEWNARGCWAGVGFWIDWYITWTILRIFRGNGSVNCRRESTRPLKLIVNIGAVFKGSLLFPYFWKIIDIWANQRCSGYLAVILRGRAGYELIYITNEAVGRVGYYQLISGKSEKNNCFSKFSSNSLDFFEWNLLKSWHLLYRRRRQKIFPTSKISAQEIRHQFFLIWLNLTIMAHMMGLGNQSESWKIIIMS